MKSVKRRYEFVDLAKGFCILFVMSIHISNQTFFSVPYISSFRMPFYFFICGLFLKTSIPTKTFIKKKINALIIPFITFETIGITWQLISRILNNEDYTRSLFTLINPWHCVNGPLWFLLCLFGAYIIYFILSKLVKNSYHLGLSILILSISSFYLSRLTVYGHLLVMPYFFSSSLTALIFIYLGALLKQKLNILEKSKYDILILLSSVIVFGGSQYLWGASDINFEWNQFGQGYFQTVIGGISGSLVILYLCKYIVKLPILSYIGRYSIIALGIHSLFLEPIWSLHLNPYLSILSMVLIIIPCIYGFVNYLPKLCAQLPFFKIDNHS